MSRVHRALLSLVVALAVTAVQPSSGKPRSIDAPRSKMTIYVFKQGLFSFAADNHEVDAPILSGSYDDATKSIELTVNATKMKALDPTLSADRRAKVQENMMGPQVLDAVKYPTITFRSTKIEDAGSNHWTVYGNLTLHGQTHPITLQAVEIDASHFSGSAVIRQSSFAITPIKVAGGLVTVKDDVKLEFQITLR